MPMIPEMLELRKDHHFCVQLLIVSTVMSDTKIFILIIRRRLNLISQTWQKYKALSHLDWVFLLNVISAGICLDRRTVQRSRPCPASTQLLHPVVCSSGRSPVDQVEGRELEPKVETSGHSWTEKVVPWHRSSSGYQNRPTGFLWRHRPHSEPWSSELMFPPGRSRSGEENEYSSLILMVSEKPAEYQVTVDLIVRPGAKLLGVGPGTGGTTCRSSRFCCCRGQRKGASMNRKPQQQLPCWSASFYPGSDDIILIVQRE